MAEEIRQHLEQRAERNLAAGLGPEEARGAARQSFGGMDQVKERCRDESGWPAAESVVRDLRFAGRQMRRSPGFSAIVVLTLALGIASTTVIFSLAYAVLLRPLPFPQPGQLVTLVELHEKGYTRGTSFPNFADWRSQGTSFQEVAAMTTVDYTLDRPPAPERIVGQRVTGGFFPLLGVHPLLGRWLAPADDRPGGEPVVVISNALWRRSFGSALDVIGRRVRLGGRAFTLVGVMPASFVSLTGQLYSGGDVQPDAWTALDTDEIQSPRGSPFLWVVARLKSGVSLESAAAEMKTIGDRLSRQYPADDENFTVRVGSMHEDLTSEIRPAIYLLFAAVASLLLTACLNVANLLLVRSTARVAEISLRAALGADRRRIILQLLTESGCLALVGGVVGIGLAAGALRLLRMLYPDGRIPWDLAKLSWPVLLAGLGISILAGVAFGLAPALRCSRLDLNAALKGGAGAKSGRGKLGRLLVASQVALAFVLLSGTAFLLESLTQILRVNPGFDRERVLTVRMYLAGGNYDTPQKTQAFYERLFARLSAIAGVETVGGVLNLPMCGIRYTWDFEIQGRPKPKGRMIYADYQVATPEYFSAMRIPLVGGRMFGAGDGEHDPRVVVINQTMARSFWPAGNAIGKRIRIGKEWFEIIGIVGDVHHMALSAPVLCETYLPHRQQPWSQLMVAIRTATAPSAYAAEVRRAIASLDADLPAADIRPLDSLVSQTLSDRRTIFELLGAFAATALGLSALGIYGALSYTVTRRSREIGIRVALGQPLGRVRRMILAEGLMLSAGGILAGWGASAMLSHLLESQLYQVKATDPWTLAAVALLLSLVAAASCWIPAGRATRIEPAVALRME